MDDHVAIQRNILSNLQCHITSVTFIDAVEGRISIESINAEKQTIGPKHYQRIIGWETMNDMWIVRIRFRQTTTGELNTKKKNKILTERLQPT